MDEDRKQALLDAVQHLASREDAAEIVRVMEASAPCVRKHPLKLAGEFAILNPLLRLFLENEPVYRSVAHLVDVKRTEVGLHPAWPPPEPAQFDKVAYQRHLMAKRRERSGRAADIENMLRPENERLVGVQRLTYERVQLNRWGSQLREQLDVARTAAGGRLQSDEQNAIRERFWAAVDASLDEKEELARKELVKPAHQRRPV